MACIDANFGLVRKKSSGHSVSSPKLDGKFFLRQEEVDNYIVNYVGNDQVDKGVCFFTHCYIFPQTKM